ncbi:MAG: NUDIX hydrolase [Ignavibacteria bacterium]|nr:NUDIX hydrolase [Ignavibacteria bacterium]
MSRELLIRQLSVYREKYEDELSVVNHVIRFVESYEDCFERSNTFGHITGSAWIVSPDLQHVLLTHHTKLDKWLQLGGHADGNADVMEVASREATEESGIELFKFLSTEIFDIDVHSIPPHKSDLEHYHFDIRYILRAHTSNFKKNHESKELAWITLDELKNYTTETSIMRMAEKWQVMKSQLSSGASIQSI